MARQKKGSTQTRSSINARNFFATAFSSNENRRKWRNAKEMQKRKKNLTIVLRETRRFDNSRLSKITVVIAFLTGNVRSLLKKDTSIWKMIYAFNCYDVQIWLKNKTINLMNNFIGIVHYCRQCFRTVFK